MECRQIQNRYITPTLVYLGTQANVVVAVFNIFAGTNNMVRMLLAAAQRARACRTERNTVPCHFAAGTVTTNRAGTAVAVVVRWFFTLQSSFSSSGACVV